MGEIGNPAARWSRRNMLGVAVAWPLSSGVRQNIRHAILPTLRVAASPPPFSNRPKLLVAGAADSALGLTASAIKARLNAMLPPSQLLQLDHVGGADGVTAANQFEANVAPDGETAMLVSGAAALEWLAGDPRAQFDVGHWLPIFTVQMSGVVILGPKALPQQTNLRLATQTPAGLALVARLGLSLLHLQVKSVNVVADPLRAVASGDADAAFLLGGPIQQKVEDARLLKMTPLFSLGSFDSASQMMRDPALPDIPTLLEAVAAQPSDFEPALLAAWQSVAAATRLKIAMLLPWLTPADVVAWWRSAVSEMGTSGLLPDADAVVWHTDPTGNFGLNPIITDTGTSLALHRWLAKSGE